MNDFKGLSRDTSLVKTPEQMWNFARNIVLTTKYLSITNEKGFEYGYSIPGVLIGGIATNEDIVYFSIDGSYSCIGYVNKFKGEYVPVLRTSNPNFRFNYNSPIEGIYVYNYKKELIVLFSDGVNNNSSTPKLINLMNPQVVLSTTKEFIQADDYLMFELFNYNDLPSCTFKYQSGALNAEVVHLAFCYVYDDDTDGMYSPIIETVYPNFKGHNTQNRNVKFTLTKLSPKYNKIKLAFIIKKEAGIFAYTTPILNIINDKVEYTLSSEEDLDATTPEEIVIASETFTKIRTITKTANRTLVGNVKQEDNINFQKYANKLKLSLKIDYISPTDKSLTSHPTFLPDEVYSFRIVPIFKKGTKAGAYHIPGRTAMGAENTIISDADIGYYGLDFDKYKGGKYKVFHIVNTGSANSAGTAKWGYWENEDTYPLVDYYNSSDIGGEDLRGKPVRHHRFPDPSLLTDSNFIEYKPVVADSIDDDKIGLVPRFYVEVANFEEAFPPEIRSLLQGYELVFDKRPTGGTYIETSGIIYKSVIPYGTSIFYGGPEDGDNKNIISTERAVDFTICNFFSSETLKDKININADIVKLYVPIKHTKPILESSNSNTAYTVYNAKYPVFYQPYERIASIKDTKYLLDNNVSSNNRFGQEELQLSLEHLRSGDVSTDFVPLNQNASNTDLNLVSAALITLNKSIYNLENNVNFISVGVVIFNKVNDKLHNGDVFATNIIKKSFKLSINDVDVNYRDLGVYSYLNYYIYNLYSPLSNTYIINGVTNTRFPNLESAPWNVTKAFYRTWVAEDVNTLTSFTYNTTVKEKNVASYFNDYIGALPPAIMKNKITYFPYRVYKGLAIPNESLQTKNLRFFPTNSYYDMRNDRGEIIALRGYNNGVYIQQRDSLFETTISDKLNATAEETFLGNTDIFDRLPQEILYNDNIGYIGSVSQFACIIFRDGYATVDEEQGKIFIINREMSEISQQNLKNYFRKTLPLGNDFTKKDLLDKTVKVDNPFTSIGYLIGFDEENNRLIVTKKLYKPKQTASNLEFDGEYYRINGNIVDYKDSYYFDNKCKTFSFALDSKTWVAEHDYFGNFYFYNNQGMFSAYTEIGKDTKIYKHNSNKVNPGNYYDKQYPSYVDLLFNSRLDLIKQYQALYWVSEAVDMATDRILQFDTIDKVMLYNNHQCSGYIDVSKESLKVSRNIEGKWQLNEFRDMMLSPDKKILDDEGNLIISSLGDKVWYEKNIFISNFIAVRMMWDNTTKVLKHIHNVNIKSVTSDR